MEASRHWPREFPAWSRDAEFAIAEGLECLHLNSGHRLAGRHAARRRERIDEDAVPLDAVIEMRPGHQTGCADASDQIALLHPRAGTDGDRRKVQILGLESVGMPQMHHPAGGAVRAGPHDHSVRYGDNGRADRGSVVDSEMRARLSEHRMKPVPREAGRHDRIEFQRRLQHEAAHRDAALVEVRRRPGPRFEPDGFQLPAVVGELRREDRSVARELALLTKLSVDDERERIARLQLGVEVDVAAENIGERQRQIDRPAAHRPRRRKATATRG